MGANQNDYSRNFTPSEFEAFGADRGKQLYEALEAAAKRGVKIRVLNGNGISADKNEIDIIKHLYPDAVDVQLYDPPTGMAVALCTRNSGYSTTAGSMSAVRIWIGSHLRKSKKWVLR